MEKPETNFLVFFGMLFFILGVNFLGTAMPQNPVWIAMWGTILIIIGIVITREGLKKH
jgi:uncharacterized membrane protein HdeD (DUF308 family)